MPARLFEFALDALDDVHAWGAPPDQSLSWFGLTQGRYRLNAGGHLLLNYSDATVAKHAADWPEAYPGPMVDYYVARLWEDLLGMLPDILTPLPRQLHDILVLPDADRAAWADGLSQSLSDEAYLDAIDWLGARVLDSGYLQHAPWLRLWSCEGQTFIAWDCTRHMKDGVAVWSATAGHHAMPTDAFVADIGGFHADLIASMEGRVGVIVGGGWQRSNVAIDVHALTAEQAQRATALKTALARAATSLEPGLRALADGAGRDEK
jgi:hypothetical protein